MAVSIEIFGFSSDNYCVLIRDNATGATAAIDAINQNAIASALKRKNWRLTDIFVTHHHWDHTDGIKGLKREFNITVTGPALEAEKIDGLDRLVSQDDYVRLGETRLRVIATPGHTLGHIAYYDEENKNLFCGDALFSLGCGRMIEGTPGPMWQGLKALRDLPNDTNVYCGHEYSANNAAFALSIDPDNIDLQRRAQEITNLRKQGQASVPFNLGEDKRANPFLRADNLALAKIVGADSNHPAQVFAAIRKAKDSF